MTKKFKKHQRLLLIVLISLCMGIIVGGGIYYVESLQNNLQRYAIENVMTVTLQQQQAFDNFISGDRERLHSFATYFSHKASDDVEEIKDGLDLFFEVNADYSITNLDSGRSYSNRSDKVFQMEKEDLASFRRALSSSGAQASSADLFSDDQLFGYYETFSFSDGVPAMIQKSYDRSKVSKAFSLSFYNDQGFAYIVNQDGDILLRSAHGMGEFTYRNIFDALTRTYGHQKDIDAFQKDLDRQKTDSRILTGDTEDFVYTYVPVENAEEWYLISIVPVRAITAQTDQMLRASQMAFGFLVLILAVCTMFILLIWHTHKDIEAKEQEADYQTQLFNIFATYLSCNTDDVYMMLNVADNHVEYVSPNLERVFGISKDQLTSELWDFEITHPGGEAVELDSLRNLEPGARTGPLATKWINPQTKEEKWFQESVYCVQIQGNRKLVLYISDRTKERKIQNSLSEALQMAQTANNAKSSFLGSVSHDIRTPMNAIIGFLALIREEADNPIMVLEYTQRIEAASQHLLGLINDVLDMNKIESGSTTLNVSELNLAEVIDEINTIIRPQTKAKNQTFDIFVSHLDYEHLLGDKLRINQILINLLSNAVKYTPENGKIQMRVEELPQVVNNYSRIRFTVSDNGLGMSADYLKVIFDPFTREETEATNQIQGTGLGMAITRSLVELLGGTIHVESELDKGSTFTVELELCIQEREDDPKFWTDHSVTRMIVADDDEEVCQNIVKTMSQAGVDADYATDGETAVQMMRSAREAGHPYDLILLDWKMPDLNGLETARLIRNNYPVKIPILLLTAYDWSEIEQEATEIGINHFMSKPFFMSTFKDAIRRVMGSRKKTKNNQSNILQGKHILVVDDIEVNRMILVKIFGTLNTVCDIASNGQEAVDKFEASQPGEYDLILMDVQMPVMDGYTATRTIRSSSHPSAKKIPIIAMTANAFVDDVRDAIESGMDAHIAKPVQLDKLKATIQQVLDSRQAEETKKAV